MHEGTNSYGDVSNSGNKATANVVCFGVISPALVVAVDEFPAHNTGAVIDATYEFVGGDAANIACILHNWGVDSGHIGTTLGNDRRGHWVAQQLQDQGVKGEFRFSPNLATPYEINVSDKTGARTFFWTRDSEVLSTLETADLSLLEKASLLYVDWYDGPSIVRAMDRANDMRVPVFLNLEHGHEDPELLARYAGRSSVCQAITDEAQTGEVDPRTVARKLLNSGVETVLVTSAKEGAWAIRQDKALHATAPEVKVVDGCCAGAVFSAGFIYSQLNNRSLQRSLQFATTAATLSCTRIGPQVSTVEEIESLMEQTHVDIFPG
jgi:sugar/nucleoside kinase (ribokinase family)